MGSFKNSYVLGEILRSLYHVAGRRTTETFAAKVIGSIIKTLEQKHEFLIFVRIDERGKLIDDEVIAISPEIDNIEPERVGRAIEAIIRIVYMDIIGKAGLFFIAELKRRAGDDLMNALLEYGVDLASLQIEQHYLYRSRERKKAKLGKGTSGVSLLGYTWKNVASWKYDPGKKSCVLYNKEGEVLDNLHLESIIENYVKNLSDEITDIPDELEKKIEVNEKEFELLKMLQSRDMDAETAVVLLHITKQQFNNILKKLLEYEFLQYISYNVIELTELGINYITKREEALEKKPITEEIKKQV
ncbi:MAG: hypothetical protein AYK22_05790 [Thermoplasmatales archaeon SG8-52-3]|nr:MAG: hypothetical protein AYK22_05790 [Thermoplasmatales archaeon SG8-52-3]